MKRIIPLLLLLCQFFPACQKNSAPSVPEGGGGGGKTPVYGEADLLNLSFSSDATAQDVSRLRNPVVTNAGFTLSSYFDSQYGRYIPHFGGNAEATVGSGYYRIDYFSNAALKEALLKGFSLEVVFSIDALPSSATGSAVVSSLQSAGFGLSVDKGGNLCYDLYAPKLISLKSGNGTVKAGSYHHVVAQYDPSAGKAMMYLDGELKASAAAGSLELPSASSAAWLCVGADCSSSLNYAERTFKGDIPYVRMYSSQLTARSVAENQLSLKHPAAEAFSISDLAYLTPCQVSGGCKYYIYGKGFSASDGVVLSGARGETVCTTAYNSGGYVVVTIPTSLVSGRYSLLLRRNASSRMLGSVEFQVATTPGEGPRTKVFAHRCKHNNNSGPYENTLEAFKATMSAGILGAEFDVWITTDGKVPVHHDGVLPSGKTFETSSWSELKNLKLPTGEHLPLLEEFLDEGKKNSRFILNFEIKVHKDNQRNRACADAVAELISARNMATQCRVMSYSEVALDRLKEKLPTLKLDYLGTQDPMNIKNKGYAGISYNMNLICAHPEWVKQMHDLGMEVTTWTPATVPDMMTFINMDVDYLTVNEVALAKTVTQRTYVSK